MDDNSELALPKVVLPSHKQEGWNLARKHLSRLVSRVQRTLKTGVAAPGLSWAELKAVFIKNRWGDLSSKTFGFRRDEELVDLLHAMGVVELWFCHRPHTILAGRDEIRRDTDSWMRRDELCVRGLFDSRTDLAGPRLTLKRTVDEHEWKGILETGVTDGWCLVMRRLSGAVMEMNVQDDTPAADIRSSIACFLGVPPGQIVMHYGEKVICDQDRAADFRSEGISINVTPHRNWVVDGCDETWAYVNEGCKIQLRTGSVIDEGQALCIQSVSKLHGARIQVPTFNTVEPVREGTCPLDKLVPARICSLRAIQVVPHCSNTSLSVIRFVSPGVGPHTPGCTIGDYYSPDHFRGYAGIKDSAHTGGTFLPQAEVEVTIALDAAGGLSFSSKDQPKACISNANVLGPFDSRLHQLRVQMSTESNSIARCLALPADPEETAQILSQLRELARQAGLKPSNVRLPAGFVPGFVHGQRVRRAVCGQEGFVTATRRGRKMYEMRDQARNTPNMGWSASYMELQAVS